MIFKNSSDVAGTRKIIYTLVWQFSNTSRFKKNIYYLLLHFAKKGSTTATQKVWDILQIKFKMASEVSLDTEKASFRYSATKIYLG